MLRRALCDAGLCEELEQSLRFPVEEDNLEAPALNKTGLSFLSVVKLRLFFVFDTGRVATSSAVFYRISCSLHTVGCTDQAHKNTAQQFFRF